MLRNKQEGFTIIELLIAIGIFAVVVPSLTIGLNSLRVINNRARDLSLASNVAENKVEQLRSSGFNSLAVGTYDFSNELPGEMSKPKNANYVITNPSPGIINIVLTVNYWDYSHNKTLVYKTIVSELGVGQ